MIETHGSRASAAFCGVCSGPRLSCSSHGGFGDLQRGGRCEERVDLLAGEVERGEASLHHRLVANELAALVECDLDKLILSGNPTLHLPCQT